VIEGRDAVKVAPDEVLGGRIATEVLLRNRHTRPRAERKRVSSRWAARTTSSPTPLWARSDSPLTISSSATLWALYSGKLVEEPDGHPYFLAWRNIAPDGTFVGELSDPFQVAVDGEGNLSVGTAQAHHLR
jgi:hypothetical protein